MGSFCSYFKEPEMSLQDAVLTYLFASDTKSARLDPYKEYINQPPKSNYAAMENFISNIPLYDFNKRFREQNVQMDCFVGARFVYEPDPRMRGSCSRMFLKYSKTDVVSHEVFANLRLDNFVDETCQITVPMNLLVHENQFLQRFLPRHPNDDHIEVSNEPTLLQTNSKNVSKTETVISIPQEQKESTCVKSATNLNEIQTEILCSPGQMSKRSSADFKRKIFENKNQDQSAEHSNVMTKKMHLDINNLKQEVLTDELTIPKLYSVDVAKSKPNFKKNSVIVETDVSKRNNFRGIVGANNSCYIDALLFSWFYCTTIFDKAILEKKSTDLDALKTFKEILAHEIVKPLRNECYCPAKNVQKLRNFLSGINSKVVGQMMDVEELIYLILEDVCKEVGFITYLDSSDFIHQLMIDTEKYKNQSTITVQQCLQNSMEMWGELQFKNVPFPALMLQLPRSDGDLIHFEAVIPNRNLDIRKFIKKEKCNCKRKATWECSKCIKINVKYVLCNQCADCEQSSHQSTHGHPISLISRSSMSLYAVICIRSAHYVTFVKEFGDNSSKWHFFDSMSGTLDQVEDAGDVDSFLETYEKGQPCTLDHDSYKSKLSRIITDGHICIYQPIIKNKQ